MRKTLKLNTWQRVMLVQAVSAQRGDIGFVRRCLKALDVLEMSDEEKGLVKLQETPTGARWEDTERIWELKFDPNVLEAVKVAVRNYRWPVNKDVLGIIEQLGLEGEE